MTVFSHAAVPDDVVSRRPATEQRHRHQVDRRVRFRRTWVELSQEEVAERARVTRNFVSIERGAQRLDACRLWAVADALGVTLDSLLTGCPDDAFEEVA